MLCFEVKNIYLIQNVYSIICWCKIIFLLFASVYPIIIDSLITYATINETSGDMVYLPNENNSTVWPGMIYVKFSWIELSFLVGPPPDGSPIEVKTVYSTVLVIFAYTWASFGILFSFFCLIFIIIFRKRKYVLCIPYVML